MKFSIGDKMMDFTEDEVHKLMAEFRKHGFHSPEESASHYWKKAKDNIERIAEMPIENERDAKNILSERLGLCPWEADLLYEIIEFAIGMRMVHTDKQ